MPSLAQELEHLAALLARPGARLDADAMAALARQLALMARLARAQEMELAHWRLLASSPAGGVQ